MLKIAVVQPDIKLFHQKANIEKMDNLTQSIQADVIVLPELFDTGYLFSSREEAFDKIEDFHDNPGLHFLKNLSKKKNCIVYGGIAEKREDYLFNSAVLIHCGEIEEIYRKKHLFNREKEIFDRDNTPLRVVTIDQVRYGMMICFDWIFPEMTRSITRLGAQVVLHCANLVLPYCPDAMITRSIENRVFTITSNRIGSDVNHEKTLNFIGQSQAVTPSGELLFRGDKEEKVFFTEIDPEKAKNKQITPFNNVFDDLRNDIYC